MAAANIYSIDSPPDFEFIVNNQEGRDIRCLNYVFRLKTSGKKSWNYLCTSKNCTASLSLKAFSFGELKLSNYYKRGNLQQVPNTIMQKGQMHESLHKSLPI